MTPTNPYATDSRVGADNYTSQYAPQQRDRYAVGANGWDSGDSPWTDNPGWAPTHRLGIGTTVDAMRTDGGTGQKGAVTPLWEGPNPTDPYAYYRRIDADDAARHSTETVDGDGWAEHVGPVFSQTLAANPRTRPPVDQERPTGRLAPTTYSFMRPFDQLNRVYSNIILGSARRFNGLHFSMADHRRTYPVTGMAPVRTSRNTYRQEPAPWDSGIVDLPPVSQGIQAAFRGVEVPYDGAGRTYRLV